MTDVPSEVELFTGERLGMDSSVAHNMFFMRGDTAVPVKGNYAVKRGSDGDKVFVRLFNYVIEGPPYTDVTGPFDPAATRVPTRFKATAINSIHARDDVMQASAFPGAGSGFKVVWDQVPEGAPEYGFAQSLTSALKLYDDMVEGVATHEEWVAGHDSFLRWSDLPDDKGCLNSSQHEALCKHFGGGSANVEIELRLRAMHNEHWQEIAPEPRTIDMEQEGQSAMRSLGTKFKDLFEGLTEEEKTVMERVGGSLSPERLAEQLSSLLESPGSSDQEWVELSQGPGAPSVRVPVSDLPFFSRHGMPEEGPEAQEGLGEDWVELQVPGTPPMPGPPPFPGMPHLQGALPDWIASGGMPFHPRGQSFHGIPGFPPFQPGAEEGFTLGGKERVERQLEAAINQADALGAHIREKEHSRAAKVALFRDVVSGGLHWLIEKIEGASVPETKPHTNGHGQQPLPSFVPEQQPAFTTGAVGEPEIGAPGEEF